MHEFLCWKRYSTKTIVILILKYLAQQTNTYSKLGAETPKANSGDCASLLTTCSMSKTFFKCFLVYYERVFVCCDVFAVTISFSMSLMSILDRFHTLIYFYLLSVLYWVRRKPPEVLFKKDVLWNYVIFTEKCLFLIKLEAFRPATILKRDSSTGISCKICENFLKFFNTFFEKHLRAATSLSRLVGWVKVKKTTKSFLNNFESGGKG